MLGTGQPERIRTEVQERQLTTKTGRTTINHWQINGPDARTVAREALELQRISDVMKQFL